MLATHRNGIRISDFFKDYDRLRSGVITEHQFMCALSLAVAKQANLSRNDIGKLVEYYRKPDGRCHYKVFTDLIDNAFNIPELEKKPTMHMQRPSSGLLGRVSFDFPILMFMCCSSVSDSNFVFRILNIS
jgi:hypothetical protein